PGGTADIAGEKISYTITVTNTGNTTLTGVSVTDPFARSEERRVGEEGGNNDGKPHVSEVWTFTAQHTVTQEEINAGGTFDSNADGKFDQLRNVATAHSNQTPDDTDDAAVRVAHTPSVNIGKDATVPGGTADIAGEKISYTITVTNTGNTTLTGVSVTDPFA